ncbi:MAG: hypothetical protein HY460_03000 [Parcubacteria group bacterium]|nr:hypothetical protein [Parcubacteria group bacterium]
MTPLQKAILATVAYHDVIEMPMTGFEVWKYLLKKPLGSEDLPSLGAVLDALSRLTPAFLDCTNGFYSLKGRAHLYETRIERQKIADEKWRRVRRIVWWMQLAPFVRVVFGSGSLAFRNTRLSSDLDVLVVIEHGRIWMGRFFVTMLTGALGVRRRRFGIIAKDKICLNHYISTAGLRIPFESMYNATTYARLVPILEQEIESKTFWDANSSWMKTYLVYPGEWKNGENLKTLKKNFFLHSIRRFLEKLLHGAIGNTVESLTRRYQRRRIERDPWTYEHGGRVTYSDMQLEFHPDSPERGILVRYNSLLTELGLADLAHERDSGLR